MKYVLTQGQFENFSDNFKKLVTKFWTQQGKVDIKLTMEFFTLPYKVTTKLYEWALEWYGGEEKVLEILKNFAKNPHRAIAGTYDFNFKIYNPKIFDDLEIGIDARVDGSGQVNIENDDNQIWDNIKDATDDESISWEVFEEIRDTIRETIEKETGLPFNMFIDNIDISEKGEF